MEEPTIWRNGGARNAASPPAASDSSLESSSEKKSIGTLVLVLLFGFFFATLAMISASTAHHWPKIMVAITYLTVLVAIIAVVTKASRGSPNNSTSCVTGGLSVGDDRQVANHGEIRSLVSSTSGFGLESLFNPDPTLKIDNDDTSIGELGDPITLPPYTGTTSECKETLV